MKLFLLTTLTALGLTQMAMAADMLDADGDGGVSWEEVQASHPDLTEDQFNAMDVNGDGALDADEVNAARAAGQLPEQG